MAEPSGVGRSELIPFQEWPIGSVITADDLPRLREWVAAQRPTLTLEQREALLSNVCKHCGGVHDRACPRVKRIRFRAGGEPMEVEFWRDDEWPKDQVLWLDQAGL